MVVSEAQIQTDFRIVMKHGKVVNVRLEDPEKKLALGANGKRQESAAVQLWSPRGVHSAHSFGESGGGQNHIFAVPTGVLLQVDVSSPTLTTRGEGEAEAVSGSGGAPNAAGVPIPRKFSISGADADKNFRYTLQGKVGN